MLISSSGLSLKLNNQMKKTQTQLQKNIDKISTGQRIRSAANDASGLTISHKLLALERGSRQAICNVQDAKSLVQVADGAMQEMTDVLHRIRELTIQATNGTNSELGDPSGSMSSADTLIIQNEIDDLKKGLYDIVKNTQFNSMKILSNTDPGEYVYENRAVQKQIELIPVSNENLVDFQTEDVKQITRTVSGDQSYQNKKSDDYYLLTNSQVMNLSYSTYSTSTTFDYKPSWTEDGNVILLSSDPVEKYMVTLEGNLSSLENNNISIHDTMSNNGLLRLRDEGSTLILEKRSSTETNDWENLQIYENYNRLNGSEGYSFSPIVDENGNTSFVYSNNEGTIKKADINIQTMTASDEPTNLLSNESVLQLKTNSNTITLPFTPSLYDMPTDTPSFQIEKINDDVTISQLTYWDRIEPAPTDGTYYTVSDRMVTIYDEGIVGTETKVDVENQYVFSYLPNSIEIPSGAEVYNVHGVDAHHPSLRISVGNTVVTNYLSERPSEADAASITGVYVDEVNRTIEFYGDVRPSLNESITIEYMTDEDNTVNGAVSFTVNNTNFDTYNLENPDLNTNRSFRIKVDGREISYYDGENGYIYHDGMISLYGDARPGVNQSVETEYVTDVSNMDKDVYGIKLTSRPEIYFDDTTSSIRVFRISPNEPEEEINHSDVDGFQYISATNTIELYGSSRPNVGDGYRIETVVPYLSYYQQDEIVEAPLSHAPETYDQDAPLTLRVSVGDREVNYDSSKTEGYFYNSQTGRIELYGNARPNPKEDIKISYIYENQNPMPGNESYDFLLESTTLDYGLTGLTEPKAIRVYQNGEEVPYNSNDGFTFDRNTNRLSLHGSYRPEMVDYSDGKITSNVKDFYVYSINENDIKVHIDPPDSYIYKVELNGQPIKMTQTQSGDGYYYDGQQVEIVGNACPNVTKDLHEISLTAQYLDSIDIDLDDSEFYNDSRNYCDHEHDDGLTTPEIDPTSLVVSLNGQLLSEEQYVLQDNKVVLNYHKIELQPGEYNYSVDYRVRKRTGFESNEFTFQVGANSGQSFNVEFSSFDNLLRNTNILCVRTHEEAQIGLEVIDHALDFVLSELGSVGAVENRLSHMAANLSNMEENTIASLSRISDTDMAKQAMELVKNQLLVQTQQGMATHIKGYRERIVDLLK